MDNTWTTPLRAGQHQPQPDFSRLDPESWQGASRFLGVAMRIEDRRLANELNAEWCGLVETETERVGIWAATNSIFAGCGDLQQVLNRRRNDQTLSALLRLAQSGDRLAQRTLIQALLASMIAMSRRDPQSSLSDYLTQLCGRIQTYPLAARPSKIANNLELDTLKWVLRDRQPPPPIPASDCDLDALNGRVSRPAAAEPEVRIIINFAVSQGLIDAHSGTVLTSIYADGLSGREAADRHATTVDMIRWRCSRAVRRLAPHAAQLAEAA